MAKQIPDLNEITSNLSPDDLLLIRDVQSGIDHRVPLEKVSSYTNNLSRAHISEFTGSGDDVDALIEACRSVHVVEFGGYTLNIDRDFEYPSDGICIKWELQGTTVNTFDNSQLINGYSEFFQIEGEGATFNGNWKVATLSQPSPDFPKTVVVDDTSLLEVGQQISSSHSIDYLPNSPSRTSTLGEYNTIESISGNSVTFKHQVLDTNDPASDVIPKNAIIGNFRFDKVLLGFNSVKNLIISNCYFIDQPNAFAFKVSDSEEEANLFIKNVVVKNIALDAISFRGNTFKAEGLKMGRISDVAKQAIVWDNESSNGNLILNNCKFETQNKDSILYIWSGGTFDTGYCPNTYIKNTLVDGSMPIDFDPVMAESINMLNFLSFSGRFSEVNLGRMSASNSDFLNIDRSVWGTTNSQQDKIIAGDMQYTNCKLDADPAYFFSPDRNIGKLTVENCDVIHKQFKANFGVDDFLVSNSILRANWPRDNSGYSIESDNIIDQEYVRRSYIERGTDNRRFTVSTGAATNYVAPVGSDLTDSNLFQTTDVSVDKGIYINTTLSGVFRFDPDGEYLLSSVLLDPSGDNRIPVFSSINEQNYGKVILQGKDNTETSQVDIDKYFNSNNEVSLSGFIKESSADFFIKKKSSGINYSLKTKRLDPSEGTTAPLQHLGAYLYEPKEGSKVYGIEDGRTATLVSTKDFTVVSGSPQGSNTINIGSVANGTPPDKGEWVSLVNDGSDKVNFYEIEQFAMAGSGQWTLTLTTPLVSSIDTDTKGALLRFFLDSNAVFGNAFVISTDPYVLTSTDTWTVLPIDVYNGSGIYRSTFNTSNNHINLPAGDYLIDAGVFGRGNNLDDSTITCALRINSSKQGHVTIRGSGDQSRVGGAGDGRRNTLNPSVSGVIRLDTADDIWLEIYSTKEMQFDGTVDYRWLSMNITKLR